MYATVELNPAIEGTVAMRERGEEERLAQELMELVLSFLPVPALCRFRTVCKRWKELLSTPSFHKLCDAHHGNRKPHFFVSQTPGKEANLRLPISGTTCFLDLDERRWYTIKAEDFVRVHNRHNPDAGVILAMDDGLVCEFRGSTQSRKDGAPLLRTLVLFDPIAKRSRKISLPFKAHPREDFSTSSYTLKYPFEIAISCDNVSRSFRIFLADNRPRRKGPFLYVYESSTKKWQGKRNPPDGICPVLRAMSSAFFCGRLYIVSTVLSIDCNWNLVSYDCEGDTWRLINDHPGDLRSQVHPLLVVSSDRLFLMRWVWESDSTSSRDLWMHEIIDGSLCEEGLRIITVGSAEFRSCDWWQNLTTAVPILRSDGSCSSVVFVSMPSGRVWTYDLASQTLEFFPANPASDTHYGNKSKYYWGSICT